MKNRKLIPMTADQYETLRDMVHAKNAPKLKDYEIVMLMSLLAGYENA